MIKIYQKLRVFFYAAISQKCQKMGKWVQPVLLEGQGKITIGKSSIGNRLSPFFLSGYSYLEARDPNSYIRIGNNTHINNSATLIADKTSIAIGDNVLIGTEFCAYDSDFHELSPKKRLSGNHDCLPIIISNNVFIGSRVTILKGVSIGENSVIAYGSVVTSNVPPNQIWGGIPAKLISPITES